MQMESENSVLKMELTLKTKKDSQGICQNLQYSTVCQIYNDSNYIKFMCKN